MVSLADASFGGMSLRDLTAYVPAQVIGCIAGAVLANAMFAKAAISNSTTHGATPAHLLAEIVATNGLLLVIFALVRTRRAATAPAAVGAYIGAAYLFTSSTSFANPALSIGRMFSNTFAGIAPAAVPERRSPAFRAPVRPWPHGDRSLMQLGHRSRLLTLREPCR